MIWVASDCDIMTDEGSSLFLCPHCGAFVSESSNICPNCGNLLEVSDDDELELELGDLMSPEVESQTGDGGELSGDDVASEQADTESDEQDGTDEPVTLFLCSVCGAFTGGDADICPQCGASMIDDGDDDETETGILPGQPEAEILDMLVEVEPEPAGPEEDIITDVLQEPDETLLEGLKNIESAEDVMSFIDSITDDIEPESESDDVLEPISEPDQEPESNQELETQPEPETGPEMEPPGDELQPLRSDEMDELLSQLVYSPEGSDADEQGHEESRSNAIDAVENLLVDEKSDTADDDTIAMCNSCGAFVSESAEVCNVCGQSLREQGKYLPGTETSPDEYLDEEEQAEGIIRALLGVDPDEVIDSEEDRFQADGSLGLCTVCGAFISEDADACTVCGTHLDEMPEFVPSVDIKDKLTDNKALAICPNCGAFVQEGATECMNCVKPIPDGARLEMVEAESREDSTDEATSLLRNFLGIEKSLDMEPIRDPSMSSLDICPDCGAFVSLNAVTCSICGNSLFDGEGQDGPPVPIAEEKMTCPNCGSRIVSDSSECPLCGMAFASDEELDMEPEGPGEDITDFLENELEESIRKLEHEAGVEFPEEDDEVSEIIEEKEPTEDIWTDDGLEVMEDRDELAQMLVLEQVEEDANLEPPEQDLEIDIAMEESAVPMPAGEHDADDGSMEAVEQIDEAMEVPEPIEGTTEEESVEEQDPFQFDDESMAEEPLEEEPDLFQQDEQDAEQDDYREPLEFIGDEVEDNDVIGDTSTGKTEPEEELAQRKIVEITRVDRDLSRFDTEPRPMAKPANWATGIYGSVLALIFFMVTYALIPGEYAPGLAVVFGTLLLIGIYLVLTERGTFFRGDIRRSGIFMAGIVLASGILLHWPMGIFTDGQGILGQPGLDNLVLSASILIVSIGILWVRARVRYIFTWFGGIVLLFLSMVMQYTYTGWADPTTSPVVLVAGLGASLVFISLIFLQYERALNTSIESDIVRGDASYLRHDYKNALASYDNALTKSQIKRVEVLGSPLMEYDVPWYSKGSALILMGEFEEGIKCLDMALAINPNNEVTWVNKGNAHSKLGEHGVSEECYERAIEINPFYEIAWNNLGNVMARRKMYIMALKHYNRAIKINPKYDDAWINKGYVLAKMGKREQAVKCLNHVGSRAKIDVPGSEPVTVTDS